jgi:SAM-dependent methyltransferase
MLPEDENHFKFGENWKSFSEMLNDERIRDAEKSISGLIAAERINGKSFLDIGCGSGLFAIAAARLGASPVIGLDVDPESILTSRQNNQRWLPEQSMCFELLSVLDDAGMSQLPIVDIVYAWGSLHHTGNMRKAIHNAAGRVKPGGLFVIAIYNRHITSPLWLIIKRLYNALGNNGRKTMVFIMTPIIALAKFLATGKNPFQPRRGMDMKHNVIDWVGGYPYEYGSIKEMATILENENMGVEKAIQANVPTGCNEFICVKKLDNHTK